MSDADEMYWLNLEFRMMLLDEGIKECKEQLEKLGQEIEAAVSKYVTGETE